MREIGFWRIAERYPGRPAIVDPGGRHTTFGRLAARVNQISHGLRAVGLTRGETLAVVLPNERFFVEIYLAAMQLGLYFTAINWHLSAGEVAYVARDCEAALFVGHERFADVCVDAASEAGLPAARCLAVGAVPGFSSVSRLWEGMPGSLPDDRSAGQQMLYTSGTTGRPKGIRRGLPHGDPDDVGVSMTVRAMLAGPGAADMLASDTTDEVFLLCGPLYHAAPLNTAVGALEQGQLLVMTDKWDAEQTLQLIERYRVTRTHMVPTMFRRLLALPKDVGDRYDVSSLRSVVHAAAPCPIEVKRRMIEWWGPIINEYYSSTEALVATQVTSEEWLKHPGTVGRVPAGAVLKILDEDGNECPPRVAGEIYAEPLWEFEYYKDEVKTAAARRGALVTVGDVGYLDEEGYLYLTDRKTDMIISGGVNIYPAEVEEVLSAHPAVVDVAVIGVPDDDWGEQVRAIVEPAAGAAPGPELERELIDFCRERIAHYKCPRAVDFRDSLPRSDSGKLYKRILRDEYWAGRDGNI